MLSRNIPTGVKCYNGGKSLLQTRKAVKFKAHIVIILVSKQCEFSSPELLSVIKKISHCEIYKKFKQHIL